ncbi:hypothetical protein [Streptomyces subrutilus]|uniref:hypothetical protein n=1 Tax=Streptomyces subrutilus TaxID=36818 RepID=UPI002E124E37|nr:hypothetical protein OG479_32755 [Streptomyces subrutilus]
MIGRPCDVPSGGHDGPVRLYPGGRLCTAHAPQARPTPVTEPATAPPVRLRPRPAPDDTVRQVTGALRIDCGTGIETKGGRPGEFWWKTKPRARYECVACHWASETVTGPDAVKAFARHIRTTHQATCTGAATEGAQAA